MKRKSPNAKEFQMWMIEVEKRVGEKTKTIERDSHPSPKQKGNIA